MFDVISLLGLVCCGVLAAIVLFQIWYGLGVLGKFSFYKPQPAVHTKQEPVSIIIAARNEYENLQRFLPSILNQEYPEFEVVVVNHCSWDQSQQYLESMQATYPRLKVSQLLEQEKYPTGKKFALTIGIKAAKYDQLLFTDADCEPASNNWLANMQSRFSPQTEIVLGYSPFFKQPGFLNKYARFHDLMTAIFYFAFALRKTAFMGVGRNLAYRKELFFKHKGFASHQHLLTGDDDLFVNQAATATNIAIECSEDSFVYTPAKTTFSAWIRQKTRHLVAGKYYKNEHRVALASFYIGQLLFYIVSVAALVIDIHTWPMVVGLYALRLVVQVVVYYNAAIKLKAAPLLWGLPIWDIIYTFNMVVFGAISLFTRNRKKW
ncbi:MAG: glycosyltransferase [Bacteroidia bacterium]|jgi:glycosyltransferase involved in cell wall biosynthesis|nr:glycosyltransferase [Bacteroidia bacterium]